MKALVKKLINSFGYDLTKIQDISSTDFTPHSRVKLNSGRQIIDLESLAQISLSIPGMISPHSGQMLYSLCYMQQLQGDVVEIGSWQGRSTSFLARAVKNSENGVFYAIDHFKGNTGKEHFYRVGKEDLSDLKTGFISNMERLGLSDAVQLLDMPNDQAVQSLQNTRIRFLFIDGDHSKEGVEKDIRLFFPLLLEGAIIVFDDFSVNFPGLLVAVESLLVALERERERERERECA